MTIRRQIAQGYAFVLGIALAGTTAGILVGSHFQKQALAAQEVVIAERKLLSDLQVKILYNRPTKQLSPYLNNHLSLRSAGSLMLGRIVDIQALLASRTDIYEAKSQLSAAYDTETDRGLKQLLDSYETDLIQFHNRVQGFTQPVQPTEYSAANVTVAQKRLISLVQGPEFANFVQLPKDLVPFVTHVERQERDASAALAQAIALQTHIIFGSLALSLAIAALIAHRTSREIAQPIQSITQLAHRINHENDFSLQVPVLGKGEVVSLANSFNQLIAQVKQLLGEVSQKNTDLETALNQLQQKQMQLMQAEKMSSLGQLVAGVAHEINNPVSFIHGNLAHVQRYCQSLIGLIDLYEEHYPTPAPAIQAEIDNVDLPFVQDDLPSLISSMRVGTQRIRTIVLSLRNFSRMDESTFKAVNIHEGLDSTLLILQHRLSDGNGLPKIDIKKDYDDLPSITCAAGTLNQVFMNVLLNAIDALRGSSSTDAHAEPTHAKPTSSPQITLRTSKLLPDDHATTQTTDWVQIEIADNGPGMSADIQARIFEPFFTTKPVGTGTGMGLPLCYQMITDTHKGKLEVFSKPAGGTAVIIQIPCRLSATSQGIKK
ncbi:MAG: ATP-binding protein [Cyanobacteria bacterium J06560_2]